jgi:hypothetical protein
MSQPLETPSNEYWLELREGETIKHVGPLPESKKAKAKLVYVIED